MNWISVLVELQCSGEFCVLVIIIEECGLILCNVGLKMVVSVEWFYDIIGGGYLEYRVQVIVWEMFVVWIQDICLECFSLGVSFG